MINMHPIPPATKWCRGSLGSHWCCVWACLPAVRRLIAIAPRRKGMCTGHQKWLNSRFPQACSPWFPWLAEKDSKIKSSIAIMKSTRQILKSYNNNQICIHCIMICHPNALHTAHIGRWGRVTSRDILSRDFMKKDLWTRKLVDGSPARACLLSLRRPLKGPDPVRGLLDRACHIFLRQRFLSFPKKIKRYPTIIHHLSFQKQSKTNSAGALLVGKIRSLYEV